MKSTVTADSFTRTRKSPRTIHVHVSKGEGEAKFWITPQVALAESWQMKISALNRAEEIVIEHREQILDSWRSYFKLNQ